MRLCRFKSGEKERLGCVIGNTAEKILDVTEIAGRPEMLAVIEDDKLLEDLAARIGPDGTSGGDFIDRSDATLLPPVARPGKLICLAGNYRAHIAESGYVEPEARANFTQQLFLKPSTSLLGDGGAIVIEKTNHRVGWETELAVVIGKGGKHIRAQDAFHHVFGYTILNDISERGLNSQIDNRHLREMDGFCDWLAGKWFDGFAPCGPWIVTKDEIADPHNIEIKFYLNGEVRQHGSTADMIFSIPEQVEYISSIMTLEPGDIISTGTPAGAGLGDQRTSLADGDELVCEIEGIGLLRNTVRCAQ